MKLTRECLFHIRRAVENTNNYFSGTTLQRDEYAFEERLNVDEDPKELLPQRNEDTTTSPILPITAKKVVNRPTDKNAVIMNGVIEPRFSQRNQ